MSDKKKPSDKEIEKSRKMKKKNICFDSKEIKGKSNE